MAYTDYLETVQKIYIAYYQRPADPEGLVYWAKRLDVSNGNLNDIIEAFANSPEAQSLYGTITKDNIADVVKAIYNAAFNRDPEKDGLDYYVRGFEKGQFSAATIMLDILNGARGDDAVILQNKLETAMNFTKALDPELDGRDPVATYAGEEDAQKARDLLKTVDKLPSTVKTIDEVRDFIKNNIADPDDPINNDIVTDGKIINMTKDVETIVGTNKDDIIKGVVDSFSATGNPSTYQAGDTVIGGNGNDVLEIVNNVGGPGVVIPFVNVSQVEKIVLKDVASTNAILNYASFQDKPTFEIYNVSGKETGFNNVVLSDNVKIKFTGKGNLAINYVGDSGTNDTANISIENIGVNRNLPSILYIEDRDSTTGITNDGIENLVIDTAGNNYFQIGSTTFDDDSLGSVKLTGNGTNYVILADIGDSNPNVANEQFIFDASENTGNVIVEDRLGLVIGGVDSNAEITYKLGAGNDTVIISAISSNTYNDTIDGGAGTNTLYIDTSNVAVIYNDKKDASLVNIQKIIADDKGTANGVNIDLDKQTEGFEIQGTKNADTIEGGKGKDTITAGAGSDKIVLSSPFSAADKITDFKTGTDKLYLDFKSDTANADIVPDKKFGAVNTVDAKYVNGNKLKAISIATSKINGTVAVGTKLTQTFGKAVTLTKGFLKGKNITTSNQKKIVIETKGGSINISKVNDGKAGTGVLFFYDTDDHKLVMYGIKFKDTDTGKATSLKLTVLTHKTIATLQTGANLAASDILIF